MRFKLALIMAILAAFFLTTINVSALWYSGVQYPNAYGIWSHITTPAVPLILYDIPAGAYSGVINWVSLPAPNWIQTGWRYYYDSNNNLRGPYQFIETCINNCGGPPARYYVEFNFQNWNTEVWYEVDYTPGTGNQWCAYIDGYQKKCQTIVTPPVTAQVESEVQINSQNMLETYFNNDYYKGPDYVWRRLDQDEILIPPDFPYAREVFQPSNFRTYRLSMVYLPLAIK